MKRRIKLTGILLTITLIITALVIPVTVQAASKKHVKITSIKSNSSVYAGSTKSLGVKVNTKSSITYKISNSKIAKVKNGKFYAYNPGKVKITIKATPKSKKYKTTSKSIYVKVLPRKPATPIAKRSGKYITISVRAAKGAQGYQYQYATNSKMKSAKTKTTKSKSYKFSSSTSKTYYIRVRTYAKSHGKTYYSGWSSIRKISQLVEPPKLEEPEKPEKPTKPENPIEPEIPPVHTHTWEKWPSREPVEWTGEITPTEETYEIAEDKNGKKIAINMCARCYEYFGNPDNDIWIDRYWDHCDNIHDAGYSTYAVYAFYQAYFCEGCGDFGRGEFTSYGYYDYSNNGAKIIYLTQWQIEELNLPMF